MAIRQFLGHADTGDKRRYHYQTLIDNVNLLTPKLLGKINHLIVESGHTVMGKKPGEPLRGRCDSFVVETNVHYPTDVNLSWDIFEPHTRWISKGKAGCPVELGVPVCIIEDPYQFILHHEVMWTGSDVDFAVPIVEITKELFPDFCAASFDRGFHSPANRVRLDELLVDNVLPKKGRLSKADREREQGETFAAMRRQHPAVESAINNLEHRGLDRVRAKGREGFARTVALAVVALNVHRLGRVLRQQALERHRLAA